MSDNIATSNKNTTPKGDAGHTASGGISIEEKKALNKRLSRLRADILRNYPFFGELIMHLSFAVGSCGTACTDMKKIIVDPEFAGILSDEELTFVLLHEVMHCVLQHPARGKELHQYLYNIACDVVVNSNIMKSMGVKEFIVAGCPAMHISPSGTEGWKLSAEQVYKELLDVVHIQISEDGTQARIVIQGLDGIGESDGASGEGENGDDRSGEGKNRDGRNGDGKSKGGKGRSGKSVSGKNVAGRSDAGENVAGKGVADKGNAGESNGSGGMSGKLIDNHDIWVEVEMDDEARDLWDKMTEEFGSKYQSAVSLPPVVREMNEAAVRMAKLKWKELLKEFLTTTTYQTDYSFAPPDRRFANMDIFSGEREYMMPADNAYESDALQNIWFCIDTSGSVSYAELSRLYGEVQNVVNQVDYCKGLVSFFDTNITEPAEFGTDFPAEWVKPVGGGGTSFRIIFDYMKEHMTSSPGAIVILTDGYADEGDESLAEGIPVLWVVINNKRDMSWGQTIHIEE